MLKTLTSVFFEFITKKYMNNKISSNTQNIDNENSDILKYAPTSENIDISINFNYWNFLLFLFPNSFNSAKDALDFYETICAKARELNEDEDLYKIPDYIWLNYKVDMKSGLVITYNSYSKNPQINTHFTIFYFENVKNESLRNEFFKLYEDNFEHLKNLGIVSNYTNEKLYALTHFVINPIGIYKSTYWAPDFCNDSFCWDKETDNFSLPIPSLIEALRKIKTNKHLFDNEKIGEIKNTVEKKYEKYKCEIDIQTSTAILMSDMFRISIQTKYFYPAEDITDSFIEPKLPYKTVDIFNV